ncbi:MAG: hypothetical protein ACLTX3_07780 [Lachnospiraceae bacterium]
MDRKTRCEEHQEEALERDKWIARLWLEAGLNYTDISRELVKMEFREPSRDSVRRAVKRMGIIDRNISYEEIDWDRVKRYTRKSKKQTPKRALRLTTHAPFLNQERGEKKRKKNTKKYSKNWNLAKTVVSLVRQVQESQHC